MEPRRRPRRYAVTVKMLHKEAPVARKLMSLVLIVVFSTALAAPAFAGGPHGGFHDGHRGGFHHGFHRFGCCFGPAFAGGVFLGAALAAPYYGYPYPYYGYSYPYYAGDPAPVYVPSPTYQAQTYAAPAVQREVCYVGGCYHLHGDGVTTAYQWVWVPSAPPAPPSPPNR